MNNPQSNDEIHTQIGDNASGIAVGKQITQNVTQHFYNQPASTADTAIDYAVVETRYRNQIVKHYNKLALTGLPEREPGLHEIALEQIFIKLNIELPQLAGPDLLGRDVKDLLFMDLSELMVDMPRRRIEPVTLSVAEALRRHPHLTIIGGPGSGKTTLTRWLAVIFARREQAKPENLGAAPADDRLPVVLELRRFAERFVSLSQQPAVPDLAAEIASFISQHAYYPETPTAFIQQALADGRCLLLLDGLDEIADLKARQLLGDAIHAFLQHTTQGYRDNLLLVTSRPHGYHSISLSAFQECEVKSFSPDDVASFIHHWYATAYGDQEQSEAADLIAAIQDNERVGELATNPLLCTIIAIVYRNNRVLPNRRVELYLKCCEALLDTWERNKAFKESGLIGGYDWQTKLELLAPVAYWLHSEVERLAAPEADFVTQLAQVLRAKQLGDAAQAEQTARQFIEVIRDRSGLLQGRGDGTLEFTHRTFQEYLAARYIAAQPYPGYIDWVMVHLHEAWWREVHLLVIGYLGSSSATADRATALLQAILAYIPAPWPWLRSSSLTARAPNWVLRLIAHDADANPLIVWTVKTIQMLILFPYRVYSGPAWLWPRWQLARRLAWLLDREWAFVAEGYLDCTPVGIRPSLVQQLGQLAGQVLTRHIYDRAYGDLSPKYTALIYALRHSVSGIPLSLAIPLTALQDPGGSVRAATADALGQLGQADAAIITALLTTLQDPGGSVRYAAAGALGQLGQADPSIITALLTALHDPDGSVRYAAAGALGQLGQADPSIITALLTALQAPEGDVRFAAAGVLGQLGQADPSIITTLLTALQALERFVRAAAADALGQLGQADPSIITALLTTLHDPEQSVRATAARALGQLGQADATIITALLTTLHDPERFVRAAAARALGQLGQADPSIITALLTTLHDPDGSMRAAAAGALGQLGQADPSIITALLTALHNPDGSVRYAVARALGQLKVKEKHLLYQLLVNLNGRMHVLDDDMRRNVLHVIGQQLAGRPLPSHRWTPIHERLERRRRLNRFRWWAGMVCVLVLAALVIVYLSARLDASSLLVRFGAAVALITGLAAGVAQVLGWTLRNPYGKPEP